MSVSFLSFSASLLRATPLLKGSAFKPVSLFTRGQTRSYSRTFFAKKNGLFQHTITPAFGGSWMGKRSFAEIRLPNDPYLKELREEALNMKDPETEPLGTVEEAATWYTQGIEHHKQGNLETAEFLLIKTFRTREKLLGPKDPATLATMDHLASVLSHKGSYTKAAEYYLRVIKLREELNGIRDRDLGFSLNNYATLSLSRGDFVQAEYYYKRALAVFNDPQDSFYISVRINYGNYLRVKGNPEEAEEEFRKLLKLLDEQPVSYSQKIPETLHVLEHLGSILLQFDKTVESEKIYQRAVDLMESSGIKDINGVRRYQSLAVVSDLEGKLDHAEAVLRKALAYAESIDKNHKLTYDCFRFLSLACERNGKLDEADALLEEGKKRAGSDPLASAMFDLNIAAKLIRTNSDKLGGVVDSLEKALGVIRSILTDKHPSTGKALHYLGIVFSKQGDVLKAQRYLTEAVEIAEEAFGESHPASLAARKDLHALYKAEESPKSS